MDAISIFALLHTAGALIGALYTTFAEIFYLRAAEDGVIDKHERKYLRRMFRGLHIGMIIVLFSAIALIVLEYLVPNAPAAVLTSPFWAIQTITIVILIFGYLVSKREASWNVASAAIFTGWWMLLFMDLGVFNSLEYVAILIVYVIASFVVAGVIGYLRLWLWKPAPHRKGL